MFKKFIILAFLSWPVFLSAQHTTVTAVVHDTNGSVYANCTGSASFRGQNTTPGAGPYLLGGSAFQTSVAIFCDSAGNFLVSLADNNQVSPTPSQWNFSICSAPGYVGGPYCLNQLITITGASQIVTNQLQAAAPLLPSGPTTFVGTRVAISNAGNFFPVGEICYICSNIGGFNFNTQPGLAGLSPLDAVEGGLVIPSSGPPLLVNNGDAVSGYCINNANTVVAGQLGARNNCVSFFGYSQAAATNSTAWGINTTTADNPNGTATNTFMVGTESDMVVYGHPTTIYGLQITLAGTGYLNAATQNIGIVVEPATLTGGALSPGLSNWGTGLVISDLCCGTAIQVGTLNAGIGVTANSQPINFAYYTSGVRSTVNALQMDSAGNLNINPASGSAAVISQSTTTPTLNLTNPSPGTATLSMAEGASGFKYNFFSSTGAGNRAITIPDPLANATLGLSLNPTNGIYQSMTGIIGCTTGATAGNACASPITVPLNSAFINSTYTVTCSPVGAPTNFPGAPYVVGSSKTSSQFQLNYIAMSTGAASWPAIDCIAIHQ